MYFDVLINGKRRVTVGHDRIEHLFVSVGSYRKARFISASAICDEPDDQYSLMWLSDDLRAKDVVSIVPSRTRKASRPIRKRRMRTGMRSTEVDRFCDFCKRSVPEVRRIVVTGDSPTICNECIELCATLLDEPRRRPRGRTTTSRRRRR